MEIKSRSLRPGGPAWLALKGVPRVDLEDYLRSWFVWLEDRSRIGIAPAEHALQAELRVRRWKTRPDLVVFRWRNADSTRAAFETVAQAFADEGVDVLREWTPKTKKPRSFNVEIELTSVHAPASAVALCLRAFEAAGVKGTVMFDVECTGHVRLDGNGEPLVPLSRAWERGEKLGRAAGNLFRFGQ